MVEPGAVRIGNQTAFSAPVADPFGFALEHRFDAFEFFPDGGPTGRGWCADDVTPLERQDFRAAAEARGVRISVHAALQARLLDERTWGSLMRDITLARDLGAQVLNLHIEVGELDAVSRSIRALLESLRSARITLALENTVTVSPAYVNRLFERLGNDGLCDGVGLCLDIGHANLFSGTHNDYLGYLDQLADHVPIVHAHIHENWGDADRHLTLFSGPSAKDATGVAGLLRRLVGRAYRGSLVLEQWPQPASLLLAARDRLRTMLAEV